MQDQQRLEAVCREAAMSLGYSELKPQQLEAMMKFVAGKDVFVVLPTGYGKSLIYASLPFVFDTVLVTRGSVIVVITPLTAIMKDQVNRRHVSVGMYRLHSIMVCIDESMKYV